MRKLLKVIGVLAAALLLLGIGAGIGAAGKTTEVAAATPIVTPTPAPTVTVTAAPEIRTVTVEKAPASCLAAMDSLGSVVAIAARYQDLFGEGMKAAFNRDADAINAVTEKLKAANAVLESLTPGTVASITSCKAAK